ncbi:MAG: hypothetical protein HUU23_15975 [Caldilineales bacterium]|nr:hypothetical protein [Caldilineales bacterium]
MSHPFSFLSAGQRARLFWICLALTLAAMAVLQRVDAPLRTAAAPQGIVSFELAGDLPTAQAILASWDARTRIFAGFSLGFDYLFMPLYAASIALALAWAAAQWRGGWIARLGLGLAWGQVVAALCDAVENLALWRLLGGGGEPWPALAQSMALIKFGLIGLGLLYALAGVGRWLLRRGRA